MLFFFFFHRYTRLQKCINLTETFCKCKYSEACKTWPFLQWLQCLVRFVSVSGWHGAVCCCRQYHLPVSVTISIAFCSQCMCMCVCCIRGDEGIIFVTEPDWSHEVAGVWMCCKCERVEHTAVSLALTIGLVTKTWPSASIMWSAWSAASLSGQMTRAIVLYGRRTEGSRERTLKPQENTARVREGTDKKDTNERVRTYTDAISGRRPFLSVTRSLYKETLLSLS